LTIMENGGRVPVIENLKLSGGHNMDKLIITAAVTGGLTTRKNNPNLPHTPREIAQAAIDCWKAGASMVHLHVRDPETGARVHKPELFKETIGIIRQECDVIINVTTGVGPECPIDERIAVIPALASDPAVKPDMASLNCGSLNFGMIDRKKRKFTLNDVQMNPWATMLHFADTMKECGVKPELEIYDTAMIHNASVLESLDALVPPLHFCFVLGVLGGMQATADSVMILKNMIPKGSSWSVCGIGGLNIYAVAAVSISSGGHARTGLEDCIWISKGVLAESNAQMVAKIARMGTEIGREIATPEEARRLLGL
jgi:3-keto-5-aminohexanoate cleavage enzyme